MSMVPDLTTRPEGAARRDTETRETRERTVVTAARKTRRMIAEPRKLDAPHLALEAHAARSAATTHASAGRTASCAPVAESSLAWPRRPNSNSTRRGAWPNSSWAERHS